MPKTLFNLSTLHKIGGLAEDFEKQLTMLVKDCLERPAVTKQRLLTIRIHCKPDTKDAENCRVAVDTTLKIPQREADEYRMTTTVNGGLKFTPGSPLDPDQDTLEFDE